MNEIDVAFVNSLPNVEAKAIAIHNLACREKWQIDKWIASHPGDLAAACLACKATLVMIPELEAQKEPGLRDFPTGLMHCINLAFNYGYWQGRIDGEGKKGQKKGER